MANEKTKDINAAYSKILSFLSGNYKEPRSSAKANAAAEAARQSREAAEAKARHEAARRAREAAEARAREEAARLKEEARRRAEEQAHRQRRARLNQTLYADGAVTVTGKQICTRSRTLLIENISSVEMTTTRPGRWVAPLLLLPIMLIGVSAWVLWMVNAVGPQPEGFPVWAVWPEFPLVALMILGFLIRVNRLCVGTATGPVVLAFATTLSDRHCATGKRRNFYMLKLAILRAIILRNDPR